MANSQSTIFIKRTRIDFQQRRKKTAAEEEEEEGKINIG
jgi:hypothetical protein